ncbi:hypothetical protein [Archangium sp.]|uniref:hypothetical protein n=1 Tax=Archangium sp. TaxID=1872627 RepID=UPI002D61E0AC|nr:hypothetical protein [Archangium sp.]HYO58075.1 hypothetical protein [Archangium sp.]
MGRYRPYYVVKKLNWKTAFWVLVGGTLLGAVAMSKLTRKQQQQAKARADQAMQAKQLAEQRAAEAEQQLREAKHRAELASRSAQSMRNDIGKIEAQLEDALKRNEAKEKELAEFKKQSPAHTAQATEPSEQPKASA